MAEFLLLAVDRGQLPQLADDPFEPVSVALPRASVLATKPRRDEGAARRRASAQCSVGFPLPGLKIRRRPDAGTQVPFDVVRIRPQTPVCWPRALISVDLSDSLP